MDTLTLNVPSISCSNCSKKIIEGVKSLDGVNDVTVDLKTQNVNVIYDKTSQTADKISKKISSMGYEVMQ